MRLFIERDQGLKKTTGSRKVRMNITAFCAGKPFNIFEPLPQMAGFNYSKERTTRWIKTNLGHLEIMGSLRKTETFDRKMFSRHLVGCISKGHSRLSKSGSQSILSYTSALWADYSNGSAPPFRSQSIIKIVSPIVWVIAQGKYLITLIATYIKRIKHINYLNISGENVNVKKTASN